MDADGTRSKGIARSLRKLGVEACVSTHFKITVVGSVWVCDFKKYDLKIMILKYAI